MSDRPIDITLDGSTDTNITESNVPTPEELAEHRKRLARVFDRGVLVDRLHVDLPPHLHGEWIPRDPFSIASAEMMGFVIDDKYATKRALNDAGDGTGAIVGDVQFMVQPMWAHQEYVKMRTELYARTHLGARQKEEKDFEDSNTSIGMPVEVKSKAEVKSGSAIAEVIKPQGK